MKKEDRSVRMSESVGTVMMLSTDKREIRLFNNVDSVM